MQEQSGAPRRPKGCGRFLLYAEQVLTRMAALYGMPVGEPKRYFLQMREDEKPTNEKNQPPKK